MAENKSRYLPEITEDDEGSGLLQEQVEDEKLVISSWKDFKMQPPDSQRRIVENAKLRRHAIFNLLAEGKSYSELSRLFGITPAQVLRDGRRMASELEAAGLMDVEYQRQKALNRLEKLVEKYFEMAMEGDTEAASVHLQIENRLAKLTGVDKPLKMKIDHSHRSSKNSAMTDADFEKRMWSLADKLKRKGNKISPKLAAWHDERKDKFEFVDGEVREVKPPDANATAVSGLSAQNSPEKSQNPPKSEDNVTETPDTRTKALTPCLDSSVEPREPHSNPSKVH